MKQLATIALCLLSAVAALAQAPTVPSGPVSEPQPQYFLAAGAGFNHYTVPQASGWMTFGAKVGDGNYTYTTVTMTGKSSSMSVGYARVLIQQDSFTLMALGDAGVTSGEGNVGGAFAGGGSLSYDVSKWTHVPKTFAVATVKVLKTSLNDVQPVFCFGIGKAF